MGIGAMVPDQGHRDDPVCRRLHRHIGQLEPRLPSFQCFGDRHIQRQHTGLIHRRIDQRRDAGPEFAPEDAGIEPRGKNGLDALHHMTPPLDRAPGVVVQVHGGQSSDCPPPAAGLSASAFRFAALVTAAFSPVS